MIVDAIVLAGGRSSRLGGEPKAMLEFAGETLLARTIRAASLARRLAIVGAPPSADLLGILPAGVVLGRESPPFGGPAAGMSTGLDLLRRARDQDALPPADFTLVLACDLPHIGLVVPTLLDALRQSTDGVIAIDRDGRAQYLAGAYRTVALEAALAGEPDGARDRSMRSLLASLILDSVAVPDGATDDVDTWDDAERLSVTAAQHDPSRAPDHQGAQP